MNLLTIVELPSLRHRADSVCLSCGDVDFGAALELQDKVKDAVKKVIAAMTVGKDVSALFTDVVKSMQTPDVELKKLIYLYIINYARSQPDKAILVVNTFQKDARDPSPLVRALAIRTMGCIRVDRITEYLTEPLRAALKDKDPYVRKTAAVCVAKLYDINPELVEVCCRCLLMFMRAPPLCCLSTYCVPGIVCSHIKTRVLVHLQPLANCDSISVFPVQQAR